MERPAEALAGRVVSAYGANVAEIARRAHLCPNQIYSSRRQTSPTSPGTVSPNCFLELDQRQAAHFWTSPNVYF